MQPAIQCRLKLKGPLCRLTNEHLVVNPKEAWDPNAKEEEKRVESQGKRGIQTQRRRAMSGISREARDPNSKEEEKRVEPQGKLGIQAQKKKRNK